MSFYLLKRKSCLKAAMNARGIFKQPPFIGFSYQVSSQPRIAQRGAAATDFDRGLR
jgi:hypothetical protein